MTKNALEQLGLWSLALLPHVSLATLSRSDQKNL
jgi:hypothetical protein